MELNLINITFLLVLLQIQGLSTWKHHKKEISFNDDDDDESKKCMYFRYNHEKGQIDTMFCQFGCCGDLDDQKCCDDPEKDKDHNRRENARLVHGLLIFAGVMLVIAISCCGFGIYKHKKAKLRKTSPQRYQTTVPITRPAPHAIFYTKKSGHGLEPAKKDKTDLPSYRSQPQRDRPPSVHTPPPRYTENAEPDPECPPYDIRSPPPPYSSMPPTATQIRGMD